MALKFNLGAKIATGALGATVIGTGGYFTYDHFSTVKISDHITKNNLVLLTAKDSQKEGEKRWADYITDGENKGNLKNYEKLKLEFYEIPEEFKNRCLNSHDLALNGNEETLYQQISDGCTKSQQVAKLIADESVTLLEATEEDAEGLNTGKRYAENDENHNPLGLADGATDRKTKDKLPKDYKVKCGIKKIEEAKNKEAESYLTFKNGCTK